MRNKTDQIIDILTEHICHNLPEIKSVSLFNGKMGVCQYLFILARYTKNKKYQRLAESLIDNICRTLSISDGISFVNGLPGVLFGLSCLVNNKYVQTDLDNFSKEIDDYVVISNFEPTENGKVESTEISKVDPTGNGKVKLTFSR